MGTDVVYEAPESFGGQRRQQAANIAEVMGRGRMADPGALGDRAQGKAFHPPLGQFGLARGQKGGTQIAVMIGAVIHAIRSSPGRTPCQSHLSNGQMHCQPA